MKKLIFAMIATAAVIGTAQAAGPGPGTPYVGVGIATVDHSFDLPGTTTTSSDGYKASGKIFGGYDFDQTWGVEAGYTDFRKSHADYTVAGVPGSAESDGHSFYLAGKATAPINDQFSAFGKLGAARNKSTLSASTPGLSRDESKTEVYAGVGLQYNLNQKVALTAEYERYGKSKDFGAKADVFTVGAKYAF
jgi:opacity protein-like surface antigen